MTTKLRILIDFSVFPVLIQCTRTGPESFAEGKLSFDKSRNSTNDIESMILTSFSVLAAWVVNGPYLYGKGLGYASTAAVPARPEG